MQWQLLSEAREWCSCKVSCSSRIIQSRIAWSAVSAACLNMEGECTLPGPDSAGLERSPGILRLT